MTKMTAGSSYFDLWKLHLLSAEIQFLAKNLCIFGQKQKKTKIQFSPNMKLAKL